MFRQLVELTLRITTWIAMMAMGAIVLLALFDIATRAANTPKSWVLDSTAYLLCLLAAAAFPVITARGGHVAVRIIPMSGRAGARLDRLVCLLCGIACLVTAWLMGDVMAGQLKSGVTTLTGLIIPKWWLTACLLYGFGTSAAIYFAKSAFRHTDWVDDVLTGGS